MKTDKPTLTSGLEELGAALRSVLLEILYALQIDRLAAWMTRALRRFE